MRRSNDRHNLILKTGKGTPYGVFLASDHCSEHERGIDHLQRLFGIDNSLPGIPGRMITRTPPVWTVSDGVIRVETEESRKGRRRYRSIPARHLVVRHGNADALHAMLRPQPSIEQPNALTGAFDGGSFAIAGCGDAAIAAIDAIVAGLELCDLAIMIGGGSANPFDRGGLVVARASMIPDEQAQTTLNADLEALRLQAAATATGIQAKLDAAPLKQPPFEMKRYHALGPSWVNESLLAGRETAHPVMFFLNPAAQNSNNFGWFTVEELEQWLEGKGPVPKVPVAA